MFGGGGSVSNQIRVNQEGSLGLSAVLLGQVFRVRNDHISSTIWSHQLHVFGSVRLREQPQSVGSDTSSSSLITALDFSNSGRTSSEIDHHDVKIVLVVVEWVVVEWVVVLQLGSGTCPVAPHPR